MKTSRYLPTLKPVLVIVLYLEGEILASKPTDALFTSFPAYILCVNFYLYLIFQVTL